MTEPNVCWVDGRLVPRGQAAIRADDSAFSEGRGCYSTARVEAGSARFAERHVERLARGAKQLALGDLDRELAHRAYRELARAAFGERAGVVRLQVSRDGDGFLHLVGVPRELGDEPDEWSAVVVSLPHEGAGLAGNLKVASRLTMALAHDAARAAGAHTALLLDGARRLVEGSGSNVFVAGAAGGIATPPLASGAVAGIGRAVLLEGVPEIEEREISEAELRAASEIICSNAVRGARPVTRLDGAPVGDGRPGPWARRLDAAFAAA